MKTLVDQASGTAAMVRWTAVRSDNPSTREFGKPRLLRVGKQRTDSTQDSRKHQHHRFDSRDTVPPLSAGFYCPHRLFVVFSSSLPCARPKPVFHGSRCGESLCPARRASGFGWAVTSACPPVCQLAFRGCAHANASFDRSMMLIRANGIIVSRLAREARRTRLAHWQGPHDACIPLYHGLYAPCGAVSCQRGVWGRAVLDAAHSQPSLHDAQRLHYATTLALEFLHFGLLAHHQHTLMS